MASKQGCCSICISNMGWKPSPRADLEERVHHNQPLVGLSKMSFAILQVFIARLESRYNVSLLEYANRSMKLIAQTEDRFALDIVEIEDMERPRWSPFRHTARRVWHTDFQRKNPKTLTICNIGGIKD